MTGKCIICDEGHIFVKSVNRFGRKCFSCCKIIHYDDNKIIETGFELYNFSKYLIDKNIYLHKLKIGKSFW